MRRRRGFLASSSRPVRVGSGGNTMSSPHTKILYFSEGVQGGTVWISNGLMVWSISTLVVVACRLTILFFSPEGIYVPCI